MRGESIFRSSTALSILFASAASLFLLSPTSTIAASVTSARDVLSRSQISVDSNHEIKFVTPQGVQAGETIILTFETGFVLTSVDHTDVDFADGDSNNCTSAAFTEKTIAASPNAATWGVGVSGQALTLTSGTDTVTADRCVRFEIGTNALTDATGDQAINNPGSGGDYTVIITGSFNDTGTISTNIVTDDSIDVTATVATSISCTVNDTATDFGTFTVATIDTADDTITWTVSTNASNGYSLTVRDVGDGADPGLYSSGASYVIESADADLSGVSIGYGLQGTKTDGDAGSAATSITAPYTATSNSVGGLLLAATSLATATGPVANATVTSTLKAKVSGLVPAGAYIDTLTYICTGIY
ncbi:MAG: hypothetical protein WD157_00950 [Patescibacteria group bacterium]